MHEELQAADREKIRRGLLQELDILTGEGGRFEMLTVEMEPDELDQGQSEAGLDVIAEQFTQEAMTITDIRAALEKLDAGGYGVCEGCGRRIPSKRIKAVPWARLCVKCKARNESAQLLIPHTSVASVLSQES